MTKSRIFFIIYDKKTDFLFGFCTKLIKNFKGIKFEIILSEKLIVKLIKKGGNYGTNQI